MGRHKKRDNRVYCYKCPYCKRPFYERREAEQHIKLRHAAAISGGASRFDKDEVAAINHAFEGF